MVFKSCRASLSMVSKPRPSRTWKLNMHNGWFYRFSPILGLSITTSIPRDCSRFASPTPDSSKSLGEIGITSVPSNAPWPVYDSGVARTALKVTPTPSHRFLYAPTEWSLRFLENRYCFSGSACQVYLLLRVDCNLTYEGSIWMPNLSSTFCF